VERIKNLLLWKKTGNSGGKLSKKSLSVWITRGKIWRKSKKRY